MTLKSDMAGLFSVGAPPQSGDVLGVTRWCARLFNFLQSFLRRPEFPGLVLSKIEANVWPEFKAEDGMLIYAAAGVLGANAGLYFRDGGTWRKLNTTP